MPTNQVKKTTRLTKKDKLLHSTVQYSTVQYTTVQYSTVQYEHLTHFPYSTTALKALEHI